MDRANINNCALWDFINLFAVLKFLLLNYFFFFIIGIFGSFRRNSIMFFFDMIIKASIIAKLLANITSTLIISIFYLLFSSSVMHFSTNITFISTFCIILSIILLLLFKNWLALINLVVIQIIIIICKYILSIYYLKYIILDIIWFIIH